MFTSEIGRTSSVRRQLFALFASVCLLCQQSVLVASAQISAKRSAVGRRERVTRPPSPSPGPSFANPTSTVFINEILYDITGVDAGEFIEVAAPAGTNMANYSIVLYNGSGGAVYDTDALSGTTTDQQGGYGFISIAYPANGIQNGSPDGIALINTSTNTLVQFLCYEGTFAGVGGLANGVTCTDIGVSQPGTNAAGTSLQLQGTGTTYGNFTWNATSIANTQNVVNTGQTFTGGGADLAPTVADTTPDDNATGVAQNSNLQIVFSEAVNVGATWFQIVCGISGTRNVSDTVVNTADNITFIIDPNTDFAATEVCTVTVTSAQVTDQDATDPPDNMAANFVFDFTTGGPTLPINAIQGSGNTSPRNGAVGATTTGIVTLLRTSSNAGLGSTASGFFLQTPDASADADPNTSEGIFVFTSSVPTYTAGGTPVAVGDELTVSGTVVEFNGLTEINTVTNISLIDTGNPLPAPVTIDATILDPTALPTQPQLEKFEAMRMIAASLNSVAPNDNFFDVETVLAGVLRPLREPGIPISLPVPPDPTSGVPDLNVPRWDENPERLKLDTNGRAGAPNVGYTSNVNFSNIAGPLDFAFGEYRLIPDVAPTASGNMSAVPVPSPGANEFTVAGFNIENFNNNATQRQKAALAIRDVLGLPDIIGVIEIFDLFDLQALVTEIQTISGVTYAAHLVEADGTSEDSDQDVGFLVKTSRVQIISVTQEEQPGCDGTAANCNTFINPNTGLPELLNDRPPLVLNANIEPAGANLPVLVVVNHTRSFIDIDSTAPNGTGTEGARVRAKRKAQSEFLADLLQNLQTTNPTTSVISVGDYNAYQFNDGYTDPVATIKGNPTADDQVVVDQSPDLVNPNFFNLIDELIPGEQYSFIFEGTPQVLDHIIVNTVAHARTTRIAIARNNADFPEAPAAAFASDAGRPERCSDHDMPVAYFSLGASQPQGSVIISEFRFRGPASRGNSPLGLPLFDSRNEFVEIYNNTNAAITVSTTDGSTGWAVVASDGLTIFEIPNGTVIPARGHYLGTNLEGYSLDDYGGPLAGSGDAIFTFGPEGIPDNGGMALFRTANPLNFTLTERLDAVGYTVVDPLYREGAGLPTGGPEFGSVLNEFSFFRDMRTPGAFSKDTGDNAADFLLASVDAFGTGASRMGAPGPENLLSPKNRNSSFGFALLDTAVVGSVPPNRVRKACAIAEECIPTRSAFGTMSIRRTYTNNTGAPVSKLRFRIMDVTTFPPPSGTTADLRAISSGNIFGIPLTGGGSVDVFGTTLEEPPFQPNGGGWNSSLNVGTIDLGSELPNGQSISVQFLVGVQQTGSFRFFISIEAR